MTDQDRKLERIVPARETSDGAGVKLRRSIGSQPGLYLDPFLMLAGKPIGEPVVQYGPFVMNTRAEIEQAKSDWKTGRFDPVPGDEEFIPLPES